jgi:HlyD family secretion protein
MFAAEKVKPVLDGKKKYFVGVILALGLLTGYRFFFAGAVDVSAVKAAKGPIAVSVEEIGYIQADDEYDVQAPVSGYVGRLEVQRGQKVTQSQTLMVLDSPETTLVLETANAEANKVAASLNNAINNRQIAVYELADAEKKLAQKKTLLAVGAISQLDYDEAKLSLDRLRSQVASTGEIIANMERQLSALRKQQESADRKANQLSIKSPVEGTVIYLLPKEGELVSKGTTVAKVGKAGKTRVNVDILSDNMGNVALGQKVILSSPVLDSPVVGTISSIYPQAFEKISALGVIQRRVRVIADLEKWGNLRSGYEVKVAIVTQSKDNTLIVPREAVTLNQQGEYEVWVVNKNQRAESRKVKIGLKNRAQAEILEGLQTDETVITARRGEISEKTRVSISN